MKVKQTIKKATNTQRVPMDREVIQYLGEFFGRSIIQTVPEEDDKTFTYSIQKDENVQLDYVFSKDGINKIKKALGRENEDTQLNVGRLAGKMWMSLIVLAYEQRQNNYEIRGAFQYKDIARLWQAQESGKLFDDIRNLFISMSSAKFVQRTQIGNETKVKFYSLINSGEIAQKRSEEEATTFSFALNNEALGLTADWIRYGQINKSVQREGYLSLPVSDLSEEVKDVNYINFRERLRLYKGQAGGYVSGEKIIRDWMKITNPNKLRRRGYCQTAIQNCLDRAVREKELASYEMDCPLTKDWLKSWKVHLTK